MPIILDGTAGIDNNATDLSYTGTLTGGTGVVNLGSGQLFKDASGNVGIGTSSPSFKLHVSGSATQTLLVTSTAGDVRLGLDNSGASYSWIDSYRASGAMAFATSNTERMRIDSSGDLLIGLTTGSDAQIISQTNGDKYNMYYRSPTMYAGSHRFIRFQAGSPLATVGEISSNGTTTTYSTSSDYRLKHDIQPMTGALAKVAALKPCTYKWNVDDSADEGFIAHELQEVCQSAVTGEKDAVDAEGNPQYQGIDTSFLVATLTAALQELKAINDAQAQTINAQQTALESLTARVVALENQIV